MHAQQTDTGCWSTVLPNGNPDGRSNLVAEYLIGERAWTGEPRFPGSAPVRVRYQIPDGRIKTELTVARGALTRSVQVTSAVTEQIPLGHPAPGDAQHVLAHVPARRPPAGARAAHPARRPVRGTRPAVLSRARQPPTAGRGGRRW
ncbi:hypothetical protein KZZ52_35295 [Dactylosporangium sp. AC04546]|uniref:hypothetical protein n=1 Tax=Dactylosporangium sp. AC04546 TaxID=2862460 RepID=UPI001EDFFBCE|nr:hypothetical protein [Dactylosporangium sp. AC04546]WVK79237.1 hypothetical protein KZZ52_35295 [Dactylosporangium sp. AC04546]